MTPIRGAVIREATDGAGDVFARGLAQNDHRATLPMRCSGLEAEKLATRSCPPSSLSPPGLVRHMTSGGMVTNP
ncbi:MAG: DUF664 domain-containing protein [Streptosporangiaceae bacterium]